MLAESKCFTTHDTSGLENLEDLSVNALKGRGVASSLNRVNSVKAVGAKLLLKLHEVALDEREVVRETSLGSLLASTANLELVVVDTNNLGVTEAGDLASGSTDTATDVKNAHARAETHHRREVVLVAGKSLEEGLSLVEATEVERLA